MHRLDTRCGHCQGRSAPPNSLGHWVGCHHNTVGAEAHDRAVERRWWTLVTGVFIAALQGLLDDEVSSATRLGGGDFAEAYRVELVSGRRLFAKTHRNPPPYFFSTEATGLTWLAERGAVAVPDVIAVNDDTDRGPALLALSWVDHVSNRSRRDIEGGVGRSDGEARFGAALAELHRSGAASFGRDDRRTTGSLALPNDPCDTWVEFYRDRRLAPLRRIATDRAALSAPTLALLDEVMARLDELGGPAEPPARLHGDLWAGNRLIDSTGTSWLIDPAAHGGHREFDLAMMRLFGGFGPDVFEAYHDAFPLADGWRQRVALHQLAP